MASRVDLVGPRHGELQPASISLTELVLQGGNDLEPIWASPSSRFRESRPASAARLSPLRARTRGLVALGSDPICWAHFRTALKNLMTFTFLVQPATFPQCLANEFHASKIIG
jgi:hypothetical protein